MSLNSVTSKASKIAYFVRVADPGGSMSFFPATEYIGRTMPFTKPQATCAMQVKDETVSFSLLHLTKKSATTITSNPIAVPTGPLARLDRRATRFADLTIDQLVAEFDGVIYHLSLRRDDAGIARLELVSIEGHDDTPELEAFELPKGAVHLDLYLRSPRVPRTLAIGFIGHLGKPGDPDTVTRCAAKVLNSVAQLGDFRILAGIETVSIPPGPSRWATQSAALRQVEKDAAIEVPVWLFSEVTDDGYPTQVASGEVVVTVDLEHANPSSGHLLCHYTPSDSIKDMFEFYRGVFDRSVSEALFTALGHEDVENISYDIVLGTVSSETVERIHDALATLTGMDLTPTRSRPHDVPAA